MILFANIVRSVLFQKIEKERVLQNRPKSRDVKLLVKARPKSQAAANFDEGRILIFYTKSCKAKLVAKGVFFLNAQVTCVLFSNKIEKE